MKSGRIDILMYHSISESPGPTNIAPHIFEQQIDAIAKSGVPVISMDQLLAARNGQGELPERSIVITFDDGFQDFADTAWPILERHGFTAINYIPTRHVGGHDVWEGPDNPRLIMNWATIKDLSNAGALFGSHTISHPDLTRLNADDLERELAISRTTLEEKLDREIRHFAPPYGATNGSVQARIAAHYDTSVGTRLDGANHASDRLDLPRIEMFYFSDMARWTHYLTHNDTRYLAVRRAMRQVGKLRKLVS